MVDKEKAELMNLRRRTESQRLEIKRLTTDLHDCRNELCLHCGRYSEKHNGACEGCRWDS